MRVPANPSGMPRYLHTQIYVNDMTESIDFYTQTLGLQLLEGPVHASRGEVEMALVGTDRSAYIELMVRHGSHPPYEHGSRYGHLAVEIDGRLSDLMPALRARGVTIVQEPWFGRSGRHLAIIADPNGVQVELLEQLP